jgi:hypothetical protein
VPHIISIFSIFEYISVHDRMSEKISISPCQVARDDYIESYLLQVAPDNQRLFHSRVSQIISICP